MIQIQKEPYGFDPDFERAVVTLAASKRNFWSKIGYALDPESVSLPGSRLALETCGQLARELGHGPGSCLIVVQRLTRQMNDGKITLDQVRSVDALFEAAEDFGLPDVEVVVQELAPVIRRRMQSHAIMTAHDQYARRGDFRNVVEGLERAARVGLVDSSVGTLVGAAGFSEIDALSTLVRLPTGILELDMQMRDSLHRGGLGVWLGGSGDGKSQALINQAAYGMSREKLFVGVGTLELPRPVQLARLSANLTGIPTNQIMENAADKAEAKRRLEVMGPHIGMCIVEEFPPHATTVRDIVDWIDRVAEVYGRPFDLLCLDYGDKLYDPKVKGDNEYLAMRYVFEGLRRDVAVAYNMWVWTGAQAGRPTKDAGKRLELHHVSDSMHKVRVADIVVTLNARDEGAQLLYFVAKNRLGRSRFQVGPVPTDFERARMVPAASEFFDWSRF